MRRPTDSFDTNYYGSNIQILTYDTPRFKIHYTEDATNGDEVMGSDGNASTIPQFVIDVGNAFEASMSHILSLGYPPLPGDRNYGGDSKFDVYILNLNSYGYTSFDTTPSDVYIVIDNDFSVALENFDPEGQVKGAIKVTAVHELFHTFQFQYITDTNNNGWWMEATSTWMEDEVYPEVKDYLHYVGLRYDDNNPENGEWNIGETYYKIDGTVAGTTGRKQKWFDTPNLPLDTSDGSYEYYKYGTVIFAKYLSENKGKEVIKNIWIRIGNCQTSAINAISQELSSIGTSFPSEIKNFRKKVYTREFVDKSYYPQVKHVVVHDPSTPQTISEIPDSLASKYYTFKTSASSSPLSLTFLNMNTGNIAVKLLKYKTSGSYDEDDIVLSSNSVIVDIKDFGTSSTYSEVVAIVMDISTPQGSECNTQDSSSSDGGWCFIATAAYGSYLAPEVLILRKFRDKWLLSDLRFEILGFRFKISNKLGRTFVRLYYKLSPPFAHFISKHKYLKTAIRWLLTPVVYSIKYHPWASFEIFTGLIIIAVCSFRLRTKALPPKRIQIHT